MTERTTPGVAAACGLIAWVGLLCSGCGPKLVHETVFETERVRVQLREKLRDGEVVRRGYAQPGTIADVRLAHLLASISHESSGVSQPTIRSLHVYDLAEGLAQAFERATPDQQVVAAAFARDRRMGIFTERRVTSFRTYLEGDEMVIEFFAIEQLLQSEQGRRGSAEYEIPSELPETSGAFRLLPGEAQRSRGPRGISAAWRDDYYRQPVSLRVREGQMKRRTVLMEMDAQELPSLETPGPSSGATPTQLGDAQLEALDELYAARQAGYLTEPEFLRRRRLILEGQLDEAGYGAETP